MDATPDSAVVVHCADHVHVVLDAAARHQRPILLTPPGAAAYAGVAYLWHMTTPAREAGLVVIVDCGEGAGFAMAAIRAGWRDIYLTGDEAILNKIDDMLGQVGGRLHRRLPEALDLAGIDDPQGALQTWLDP